MAVSESYLKKLKQALRLSAGTFDDEVADMIEAARKDLSGAGVAQEKAEDEEDAAILAAIKSYCRAVFWTGARADKAEGYYLVQKDELRKRKGYRNESV